MAKTDTSSPELTEEFKKTLEMTKMLDVEVDEELKKSFIAYAMAVNVSRAIPDVRDGLKPVHRRILYSMHDLGLYADKEHRKCARIVGDCLGKYHPHGDSSVYDALVRLAQDFTINFPLVDGQGNFGSVDGDPAAAMRYTEAKLTKLASEMLRDLDKDTVDFYPTFDDTGMQPSVLPSRFPNMLVNGSDGIAVGMATNIPPHNLGEVIDGVCAMIDNPDIDIFGLMQHIPAPDFPTGGLLMGKSGARKAYLTGRGSIIIRSKCDIEEYKSGNQTRNRIVVTEIPYQVNKARLVEKIADLVKDKKLEGISDIREESDRDGIRIVIELKKDSTPQVVLNSLYKHTDLQISNGLIMLALVDGVPKVLNLKEFIYHYLEHQKTIIRRRTKYDLQKVEERAHLLRGLIIAQASIDEVVEICKTATDKNDCVTKLCANFELDEKQANAVAELRLYRLSHLEVNKIENELEELNRLIKDYRDILANESRVLAIIKTDLLEIKRKYPSQRKTEIVADVGEIDDGDLVPEEDVVISLTSSGYIKRISASEYKAQGRGGKGITAHKTREEDNIDHMFICSSHANILLFSNLGKVYSIKAFRINEAERSAKGRSIVNFVNFAEGEKVSAIFSVTDEKVAENKGYIALLTKCGYIKKTPIKEYSKILANGKIAILLNENDELISAAYTTGENDLLIASSGGKAIRFTEKVVRSMGRSSAGVRTMKLGENESIVDMVVIDNEKTILTISENGIGKRTDPSQFPQKGRRGIGIKVGNFDEKTGKLVCLRQVSEDEDIMIMTLNGMIIRMHCSDIKLCSRSSKGVILMRMNDDKVSACEILDRDDDEEIALPDSVEIVQNEEEIEETTEEIEYIEENYSQAEQDGEENIEEENTEEE